ncbi:hypothetical protein ACFOWX_09020 [Sphingorhabdus arenilitoris]|uniref:Uncharacterized protein n=1 Tax=Sphingorhabdus arenilitoris TaxID=1490041 RepID=A0ABV8RHV5_9SPHN
MRHPKTFNFLKWAGRAFYGCVIGLGGLLFVAAQIWDGVKIWTEQWFYYLIPYVMTPWFLVCSLIILLSYVGALLYTWSEPKPEIGSTSLKDEDTPDPVLDPPVERPIIPSQPSVNADNAATMEPTLSSLEPREVDPPVTSPRADSIYHYEAELGVIKDIIESISSLESFEPRRHQFAGSDDSEMISSRNQIGWGYRYDEVFYKIKERFPDGFENVESQQADVERDIKGDAKYLILEEEDRPFYSSGEQKREHLIAIAKLRPLRSHLEATAREYQSNIDRLRREIRQSMTYKQTSSMNSS